MTGLTEVPAMSISTSVAGTRLSMLYSKNNSGPP
ncbi:unnamed protein product [Mycetohabitans rhizoxinica HKI 454]|uniref:Uncharacterized protein n=1 Tax=Mycetohabitans rhizoxinica (strain DSM 19002 / CIP 109453 / HKI 454) TaxID=882378 RepID=E5AR33_MYCRK|nr:unnamed protein product [Mycetohabitans rhizoxinica HKI 454]